MHNIRIILEGIFFEGQKSNTIVLSFSKEDGVDLTDIMTKLKTMFDSMGIGTVNYVPDTGMVTVITLPEHEKEVLKIANDFNAVISYNGFESVQD